MTLSRQRLAFLVIVLALLATIAVVQLVRFQIVQGTPSGSPSFIGLAGQAGPSMRGRIWDRNGQLLATDDTRFEVLFDRINGDVTGTVREVIPLLAMPPDEFRATINVTYGQVVITRGLLPDKALQVNSLEIHGVSAQAYWHRVYPEGQLAAHVLGFVNAEPKGFYGVEGHYNAQLNGQDAQPAVSTTKPGADLVLTIDRTAQAIAEEELARGLQDTGAKSGSIIVMNPRNGEILVMASAPGYDPNAYADLVKDSSDQFVDPAVSSNYEPGSVFKIITLAAALDLGTVTPETTYLDTPYIEVGGRLLWNWDRQGHGVVNMIEMMAKSLNVGAATLSTRMGQQNFYRYLRAFGIGRPTGIDLQGEAAGLLRTRDTDPADWSEADLGTNAFGQGLAVTPIQLVTAVAAAANDGFMVQPHIVKQIVEGDKVTTAQVVRIGRPITERTAHTLTDVLVQAVNQEVEFAQVPGYRIAGKTGTAQIPIAGGYDDPWTIASFIGYGPASNPQLIILVKLDRPTTSPYGSATAAPVFQRVATRLFALFGIQPDATTVASVH